jgi:hypothetical protein
MKVDSAPFTSVAQAMGQTAQAAPPPKPVNDNDRDDTVKAAPSDGTGSKLDFTA